MCQNMSKTCRKRRHLVAPGFGISESLFDATLSGKVLVVWRFIRRHLHWCRSPFGITNGSKGSLVWTTVGDFFVVFNVKYCQVRQQRDQILDNVLPGKLLATSVMSSYVKLPSGGKRCSNQMLFILWSYFSLETPGTKPTEQRSMSRQSHGEST